jgi:hypothetical protein
VGVASSGIRLCRRGDGCGIAAQEDWTGLWRRQCGPDGDYRGRRPEVGWRTASAGGMSSDPRLRNGSVGDALNGKPLPRSVGMIRARVAPAETSSAAAGRYGN